MTTLGHNPQYQQPPYLAGKSGEQSIIIEAIDPRIASKLRLPDNAPSANQNGKSAPENIAAPGFVSKASSLMAELLGGRIPREGRLSKKQDARYNGS
ncbi:hypothetical protein A8M32_23205 [Sinorhizobium alkalisoli]|uniref:Uncharacterized protein n=1 Tax=Sinorhizobium alkalisoli TaxID=1752398 RepID=A0A1E3V7A0_9HYPH|nr:hypothetical protein A8M32_23205 [Sinorhizobium alkalisoli]